MTEQPTTLEAADEARDHSPEQSIEYYYSIDPTRVAMDSGRIHWLTERLQPVPPEQALPILRAAADQLLGDLAGRRALQLLSSERWFCGRTSEAEAYWRRSLEAGRNERDGLWISACLNLAVALNLRGCSFESLVLAGMGQRAATDIGQHYRAAFGLTRRGRVLADMHDFERAEAEFEAAEQQIEHVEEPGRRRIVEATVCAGRALLHRAQGKWAAALESSLRELSLLEEESTKKRVVVGSAHLRRLTILFDLEPDQRETHLKEIEAIPARFGLEDRWYTMWRQQHSKYRMRYALESTNDHSDARSWALDQLETLEHEVSDTAAQSASDLGHVFARIDDSESSRRAFDLAATTTLRRLVDAHSATHEIPELSEASEVDWEILADHRERLSKRQIELLESVKAHWHPGNEAFDLVANEPLVRVCAWCQRVRSHDAQWIPLPQYLPIDPNELSMTHGICRDCRQRHFESTSE